MSSTTLERPTLSKLTQPDSLVRKNPKAIEPSGRLSSEPVSKAASLIDLEPESSSYSIAELRSRLGLAPILQGNKVSKIVYNDRYLTREGAELLAKLLRGEWLDGSSEIVIYVLQDEPSWRVEGRKAEIVNTLRSLLNEWTVQITVKMIPWERRDQFPHKRELKIHRQDDQVFRALFDKGLDFVKARSNDRYQITHTTYVVVTSTAN